MEISVIVPCYNEQESLPLFYKEISNILQKMENFIRADIGK